MKVINLIIITALPVLVLFAFTPITQEQPAQKFRYLVLKDVAQKDSLKPFSEQHTIYTEIFGNVTSIYSVGYDYTIKLKSKHKLAFNCGLQFVPIWFSIASQISYLYGKKHHIELGIGGSLHLEYFFSTYFTYWSVPFRIGYRYQSEFGGFFFKIAYTPQFVPSFLYDAPKPLLFLPVWGGVAFGYTFK